MQRQTLMLCPFDHVRHPLSLRSFFQCRTTSRTMPAKSTKNGTRKWLSVTTVFVSRAKLMLFLDLDSFGVNVSVYSRLTLPVNGSTVNPSASSLCSRRHPGRLTIHSDDPHRCGHRSSCVLHDTHHLQDDLLLLCEEGGIVRTRLLIVRKD